MAAPNVDFDKPDVANAHDTDVDALRDGWRLIQSATLEPPSSGDERRVSYLKHEFVFEKLVEDVS